MKYIITESQYKIIKESVEFEKIYKDTYPKMFRSVCMKYAKGDRDLADEFCQLGYLKVYDKLHTFRGEGSLEGWVRIVITRTILTELTRGVKSIQMVPDFDYERNDLLQVKLNNLEY